MRLQLCEIVLHFELHCITPQPNYLQLKWLCEDPNCEWRKIWTKAPPKVFFIDKSDYFRNSFCKVKNARFLFDVSLKQISHLDDVLKRVFIYWIIIYIIS